MMKDSVSISICVPAFNEEVTLRVAIEDLIFTLSCIVHDLEIIIVDDGSKDSTSQLADQLAKEYSQVKVIHHGKNLGIGTCYRNALAVAKGDYFTWFPSDHENSAEEFIKSLHYLKEDTIVTCHHQGRDPRSFLRRWISLIYIGILNKYFHINLKYYNGLTIFPISVLRSFPLVSNGFFLFAESVVKAIKKGCKVVELSAPLGKRELGKSKSLSFLSVVRMARDAFCFIFLQKIKI